MSLSILYLPLYSFVPHPGTTALHFAALVGNYENMAFLVSEKKANPHRKNARGDKPIQLSQDVQRRAHGKSSKRHKRSKKTRTKSKSERNAVPNKLEITGRPRLNIQQHLPLFGDKHKRRRSGGYDHFHDADDENDSDSEYPSMHNIDDDDADFDDDDCVSTASSSLDMSSASPMHMNLSLFDDYLAKVCV